MKTRILVMLPILCVLALQACCPSVDTGAERDKLLQTDRDFAAFSLEKGAAEAFNRYLAEDALQLPAGKAPVSGRAAIYRNMAPNQDKYDLGWEPQQAEVARSGELGWSWGTYIVRYTNADGEPAEEHGKYVNVWKKQPDGRWRVILDTGNQSPSPP